MESDSSNAVSSRRPFSSRRQFLKGGALVGGAVALPYFIPAVALGRDGAVAPGEKITLGAIGIGGRGSYDLGCMLEEQDVRCVAVCDVRTERREAAKRNVDNKYGNKDCAMYTDFRELLARPDIDAVLIATGPNWHALASIMAAKAGKDVYCEKPCTKNIADSLTLAETFRRTGRVFQGGMQRRSLPNFEFAAELAQRGKLGKLTILHAHPGGLGTESSGWPAAEPDPGERVADWDMYLGPAAWRPFSNGILNNGGGFEKGGGLVGGGCLEWGSHCVDLCQWANQSDDTAAIEYWPEGNQLCAKYATGVKLIMRNDGWLNSGSCPVRYEGEGGWVETGDNGDLFASSMDLIGGKRPKSSGYPANFHIRNFFDCVKSRNQPRASASVACQSHIVCHAANIAQFLGRKLKYDPVRNVFIGDEEANRLRSEALREPWRI
ncbi:MAG: Gfo/Idh/MocA family oxidoreductase [Verrucomicrobia bacterium]|nr:Gfo/Idh/MocA family oxidoreductase [Verrucomicrobiota bacterium]